MASPRGPYTRISHFSGYVDNLCSTPYPPRETVAHGEGERYGGTTGHPSAPGIPAAQPLAFFECPEPRCDRGLSGVPTCPPLCTLATGRHDSRPQKLRGPDTRGAPGPPLCAEHYPQLL